MKKQVGCLAQGCRVGVENRPQQGARGVEMGEGVIATTVWFATLVCEHGLKHFPFLYSVLYLYPEQIVGF